MSLDPKRDCCWILSPASPGGEAVYCGRRVQRYKVVRDDDDNKVRKYDTFCAEHQPLFDKQKAEDGDEWA